MTMITLRLTAILLASSLCAGPALAVTFDWARIGDPGNVDDIHGDGYGGVDYAYNISKYEVTNTQYVEFLNAVDPSGTNSLSLYTPEMAGNLGGIEQTGTVDGARYMAQAGREQQPVTYVSFFDAMRFVNWLHNGQGAGDTESGAYTIGSGVDEVRSNDAKFWIPSEDEWYKAAYYDPTGGVYYDYPTGTDSIPYSDNPASLNALDDTNVGNFYRDDSLANGYNDGFAVSGSTDIPTSTSSINPITDVGAYSFASSPYGTFDQGGNVYEWTETVVNSSLRSLRGSSWRHLAESLHAADSRFDTPPLGLGNLQFVGFRVASVVPEPSSALLGAVAYLGLVLRRNRF